MHLDWEKNMSFSVNMHPLCRLYSEINRQRLLDWSRKFTQWEENIPRQSRNWNHSSWERKELIKPSLIQKYRKWLNRPRRFVPQLYTISKQNLAQKFTKPKIWDIVSDSDANRALNAFFLKEAKQCLDEHTRRIKEENGVLRKELLQLIKRTRALHEHRRELEEQHKRLIRELQYSRDLKKLRGSRQNRLHQNFGITEGGEGGDK